MISIKLQRFRLLRVDYLLDVANSIDVCALPDGPPESGIYSAFDVRTQGIFYFIKGIANCFRVALVSFGEEFAEMFGDLGIERLVEGFLFLLAQVELNLFGFAPPKKASASRSAHNYLASGTVAWSWVRASCSRG